MAMEDWNMPIYEYLCSKCGHKFELLKAKMTKNSIEKCPKCGADAHQQLSVFGVGGGNSENSSCPDGTCSINSTCPTGTCPFTS